MQLFIALLFIRFDLYISQTDNNLLKKFQERDSDSWKDIAVFYTIHLKVPCGQFDFTSIAA